jgi:hypothetical protein
MNTKLGAILVCVLAVAGIIQTIKMFRNHKFTTRLLFVWLFLWAAIGCFALFPHWLDYLMKTLNFGSRPFFLFTGAILILYIIIFHLSATISKLNHKILKLTQELAMLRFKLEQKEDSGDSTNWKD